MKSSTAIEELYKNYYDDEVGRKRAVAARQTVSHITSMVRESPVKRLLDIGAGDGAVLAELQHSKIAGEYYAYEISDSGLQAIQARQVPQLIWARRFNGYRIEAGDQEFDLGITAHVLEHVEHERAFLRESARVSKLLYVEVPLELTVSITRAISYGPSFGHINFYTPETFRNLLVTSGLEIVDSAIFPNSLDYERYEAGRVTGSLKYLVRSSFLRFAPAIAPRFMTYLAGALVRLRR